MWKFSNPTQPKTDDFLRRPETSSSNVEAINVDSHNTLNLFEHDQFREGAVSQEDSANDKLRVCKTCTQ